MYGEASKTDPLIAFDATSKYSSKNISNFVLEELEEALADILE